MNVSLENMDIYLNCQQKNKMGFEIEPLAQPNLRRGWEIFATRPLSLVAALILAIVICLMSFMLLTFPAIVGYYYAVRQSRREEYFIDLVNIMRTMYLVFSGMRRYLVQSYLLGFLGLFPIVILYFAPILPMIIANERGIYISLILQILWLPAFFLAGAIVFYGYPHLLASNNAIGSLRYALFAGKKRLLGTFGRGIMLLCPIPAAIIHFLMVLSYPILTTWAVATSGDSPEKKFEIHYKKRVAFGSVIFGLGLAAVMFVIIYFLAAKWGGIGLFIGLGISFVLVFLFSKKLTS